MCARACVRAATDLFIKLKWWPSAEVACTTGSNFNAAAESTDHLTEAAWDWNWLKTIGLADYINGR